MNFADVFDFDDDEYFECSEFDRQIDEFKQALIVNAREEIKDKIVALPLHFPVWAENDRILHVRKEHAGIQTAGIDAVQNF